MENIKIPIGSYLLVWNTGEDKTEKATQLFSNWRHAIENARGYKGVIQLFEFQYQNPSSPSESGCLFWHLVYEGEFKEDIAEICYESELENLFHFLSKPIEVNIYFRENDRLAHGCHEERLLKLIHDVNLPETCKYYDSAPMRDFYVVKKQNLEALLELSESIKSNERAKNEQEK